MEYRSRKRRRAIPFFVGAIALLGIVYTVIAVTSGGPDDGSVHSIGRTLLEEDNSQPEGSFPTDIFSNTERKNGAVVLHFLGMAYMFVALAIVCDDYFVPSLEVITETLGVSDDVAGATFMAAGGSAPELFTSLIGTFLAESDVGFGTIVGSAVFNVLFVIGMCAVFSKEVLTLTWWPLARDVTFYSVALGLLTAFFLNEVITWYEALILLLWYGCYVGFMKWNEQAEEFVRTKLCGKKHPKEVDPENEEEGPPPVDSSQMIKAASLARKHSSVTWRVMRGVVPLAFGHPGTANPAMTPRMTLKEFAAARKQQSPGPRRIEVGELGADEVATGPGPAEPPVAGITPVVPTNPEIPVDESDDEDDEEEFDPRQPVGPSEGVKAMLKWWFMAPINFVLWLTIPRMSNPAKRKLFALAFLLSIMWIGVFSYFMVWWAAVIGFTLGIPDHVMGLTILAAGTSVPDLITSVLVARQGLGDMAVSSSIGSNIFDVTMGLPFPWLLKTLIDGEITVGSDGLMFSLLLLFGMLVAIIITIAASGWKMTKFLGGIMFALYLLFLTLSLLASYGVINVLSGSSSS